MQLFELMVSARCSSRSDLDAVRNHGEQQPAWAARQPQTLCPTPVCSCCDGDVGGNSGGAGGSLHPHSCRMSQLDSPMFFLCPSLPFAVHNRDILAFSHPHGSDFTCVLEKQCSALSPVPNPRGGWVLWRRYLV